MKITAYTMSFLILLGFSVSAFAEKVIITGAPVILEQQGNVYSVPQPTTSTTYNYVTVGGREHVCYGEVQPAFEQLSPQVINVEVGSHQVQWTCYPYNDAYFTVEP